MTKFSRGTVVAYVHTRLKFGFAAKGGHLLSANKPQRALQRKISALVRASHLSPQDQCPTRILHKNGRGNTRQKFPSGTRGADWLLSRLHICMMHGSCTRIQYRVSSRPQQREAASHMQIRGNFLARQPSRRETTREQFFSIYFMLPFSLERFRCSGIGAIKRDVDAGLDAAAYEKSTVDQVWMDLRQRFFLYKRNFILQFISGCKTFLKKSIS